MSIWGGGGGKEIISLSIVFASMKKNKSDLQCTVFIKILYTRLSVQKYNTGHLNIFLKYKTLGQIRLLKRKKGFSVLLFMYSGYSMYCWYFQNPFSLKTGSMIKKHAWAAEDARTTDAIVSILMIILYSTKKKSAVKFFVRTLSLSHEDLGLIGPIFFKAICPNSPEL